jgi:hypothetical protein
LACTCAVKGESSDGTGLFTGLWWAAYSNPATARMPAPRSWQPTITAQPGTDSVLFTYAMPNGTTPNSDGDWAGLWKGQPESQLYKTKPTWFIPISSDDPQSSDGFENVTIVRQTEYTIGYFKGGYDKTSPKQTTLACSVTFRSA